MYFEGEIQSVNETFIKYVVDVHPPTRRKT